LIFDEGGKPENPEKSSRGMRKVPSIKGKKFWRFRLLSTGEITI